MALEEFSAGPYAIAYRKPGGGADNAIGLTEDGFELQFTPRGQNIEESAEYGSSIIDGVIRGHTASMIFKMLSYYKAALYQVYWQYNAVGSPLLLNNATYPVGRLYSSVAGKIVAQAAANTPARSIDNTLVGAASSAGVFGTTGTLTANLCFLAPGQPVAFQMSSKLRTVPLAFIMLPYSDGSGNIVYGTAS